MRRTKIVCTIGPATNTPQGLLGLLEAGMDVARLNLSHGTHEEHAAVLAQLRALASQRDQALAILLDLSGPKVRVGEMEGGLVVLEAGSEVTITNEHVLGNQHMVGISIPELIEAVPVGAHLLLDDGLLDLKVTSKTRDSLVCTVITGGSLFSHKGVNAPHVSLPIASVTEKDLEDLTFGIAQHVDWIAVSFVRYARDVELVRAQCKKAGVEIPIIAKIEKHEAVSNIDEILAASDGIMVARGDLGVEIHIDEVPVMQKMIVKKCNAAGKPVITATQMLDSMMRNPRPTRAEVSDVANAIYDGTDAVMLSGETAVGAYPLEAVCMMDKIACSTERALHRTHTWVAPVQAGSITQAISQATCEIAEDLNAVAIITATTTGSTAIAVSRFRPGTTIVAATSDPQVRNRLSVVWGVCPLLVPAAEDSDSLVRWCVQAMYDSGMAKDGEIVVVTGGVPVNQVGQTNFLKVHRMGASAAFSNSNSATGGQDH